MTAGMQGSNKGIKLLFVLGQLLDGSQVVMEGLKVLFYSLNPGVPGLPASPLVYSEGLCLPYSLLITCPIHLHRLRAMMVPMLSWLQ